MKKEYFVIVGGDVQVYGPYTREELLNKLKAEDPSGGGGYWGNVGFYSTAAKSSTISDLYDLPHTDKLLIIKGDIIVPRPKTVVMDYDL